MNRSTLLITNFCNTIFNEFRETVCQRSMPVPSAEEVTNTNLVVPCGWVEATLIDGLAFVLLAVFCSELVVVQCLFLQYSFLWWWHKVASYWLVFLFSFCPYCLSYFSTFKECVWFFLFFLFFLYISDGAVFSGSNGDMPDFLNEEIRLSGVRALSYALPDNLATWYLLSCIPEIFRRYNWHFV